MGNTISLCHKPENPETPNEKPLKQPFILPEEKKSQETNENPKSDLFLLSEPKQNPQNEKKFSFSLRQDRFFLDPFDPHFKPFEKGSIYPAFIAKYLLQTKLNKYGWDFFLSKLSPEILEGLVEAAIEGILLEGSSMKDSETAQQLAEILNSAKEKSLDFIGETCLNMFTMETFLYKTVNKALQEVDESKIMVLGPYCLLLFFFLKRSWIEYHTIVKNYEKEVFIGTKLTEECINKYEKLLNSEYPYFAWQGFTSTTKNIEKAKENGNVLFRISFTEKSAGADIELLSVYPEEEEVLLNAYSQFEIKKIERREEKIIIYLNGRLVWEHEGLKINEINENLRKL